MNKLGQDVYDALQPDSNTPATQAQAHAPADAA